MSKKISVLIVDDSALIRQMFAEMLSSAPDIEVCDTAYDPYDAREKIKRLNPDVITLDIEMPKMDGLSFLEKIMTLRPMPVVMASTLTQKGADATIRALELGAIDYVSKPVAEQNENTISALKDDLIRKVRMAAIANVSGRRHVPKEQRRSYHPIGHKKLVVAIGSSTGGVETLRDIFLQLPQGLPPILITQHMPPHFTRSLAARLNNLSAVTVAEAEDNMPLQSGCAYIAPGDRHLILVKAGHDYRCKLDNSGLVSGHKPSVDMLFSSVALVAGEDAIGLILTGMGKDGAEGLLKMRQKGAHTFGQNQASCVVYGMPKVAHNIGAVIEELPLSDIPERLVRQCEKASA